MTLNIKRYQGKNTGKWFPDKLEDPEEKGKKLTEHLLYDITGIHVDIDLGKAGKLTAKGNIQLTTRRIVFFSSKSDG